MAASRKRKVDNDTETRILNAARKVFTRKGYVAARTRDIAEEAGINLALLNYYFRSKEKLFEVIMLENIGRVLQGVREILDDPDTSLVEKTRRFVASYTSMLTANPELPLFILGELRSHPEKLVDRMGIKEFVFQSVYFRQLTEHLRATGSRVNAVHFFLNTVAMSVFPFVAAPILKRIGDLDNDGFIALVNERSELVPRWFEAMLNAT